jgi:hypothetical protein
MVGYCNRHSGFSNARQAFERDGRVITGGQTLDYVIEQNIAPNGFVSYGRYTNEEGPVGLSSDIKGLAERTNNGDVVMNSACILYAGGGPLSGT